MAFSEENGNMVMPVSPMYGNGGNGFGDFGNSGWWIILLFLLLGGNGWGNNANNGANGLYPWMNQSNQMQDGFQNQMLNSQLTGIQQSISNGFSQAEIGAANRQMSDMQQAFAMQTAIMQGQNAMQSQFANCCCENRLASANLESVVRQENCADREAMNYNTRDIINSQTAGIQRILDQLCQDKIDAKNEKIAELQSQLQMAQLAASQTAQTARLITENEAQTAYLVNRIAPYPIPAYTVTNPSTPVTTT